MNRLSQLFSYLLALSMVGLLIGLVSGQPRFSFWGLAVLISIPICRAIYSAAWFLKTKNIRAMWFSIAVIVALAVSLLLEV